MAAGLISKDGLLTWLVAALLALWIAPAAAGEKVEVTDPYIELHTGPGRGYPVFHVAARHEWIEIELRHTDWYKVRTEDGKEGWVTQEQLETTLTQIGTRTVLGDVGVQDYLRRRLEFGAAYGHFKSEPMLKVWTSYNFTDTLAVEATGGQVQGTFSGTDLWYVNLLVEPFSDWRQVPSPYVGVGIGRLNNFPNASLVGPATSNSRLADATVGLRYHLGRRFLARLDYTQYLAYIADNRTDQYRAVTIGFGFFF
ncbi:MAG TPA: SH3 domain-containing protein [Burkholderiaceae bacterium]|nr:SH3 domain-containing protein [Burkholderiaceae bacterium]